MIEEINRQHKKKYIVAFVSVVVASLIVFVISLMFGQYGYISIGQLVKMLLSLCGSNYEVPKSYDKIVGLIRLPRTFASFLVGGALSISGLVYQNTFNNSFGVLNSPDIEAL